jgi:hypothetical protein
MPTAPCCRPPPAADRRRCQPPPARTFAPGRPGGPRSSPQIRWMFPLTTCHPWSGFSRFTDAPAASMNLAVETKAGESPGYSAVCRRCGPTVRTDGADRRCGPKVPPDGRPGGNRLQSPYEADGFPSRSKMALFGHTKMVVNRQGGHLPRPRIRDAADRAAVRAAPPGHHRGPVAARRPARPQPPAGR